MKSGCYSTISLFKKAITMKSFRFLLGDILVWYAFLNAMLENRLKREVFSLLSDLQRLLMSLYRNQCFIFSQYLKFLAFAWYLNPQAQQAKLFCHQ
mmetsp:Transcript_27162/g.38654  ORF Transcript_27162/g.38654 Transcript_27162/m.38654 type:complete len:96 (-) Transcript_27162:766-1053(-)